MGKPWVPGPLSILLIIAVFGLCNLIGLYILSFPLLDFMPDYSPFLSPYSYYYHFHYFFSELARFILGLPVEKGEPYLMRDLVWLLKDEYQPALDMTCRIRYQEYGSTRTCPPVKWSKDGMNFTLVDSMQYSKDAIREGNQYLLVEGDFASANSSGGLHFLKEDTVEFSNPVEVACLGHPEKTGIRYTGTEEWHMGGYSGKAWKMYLFDDFMIVGLFFDDAECIS